MQLIEFANICLNWHNEIENSEYTDFKALFPAGTKIIDIKGTIDSFEAQLRCRCKDREDFRVNWLKEYEDINKLSFRVGVTRIRTGKVVLYKAVYRCHQNTYPNSHRRVKKCHKKNTNCPAVLRITIKSPIGNRRTRCSDTLRAEYPTLITVVHKHNHTILTTAASYQRDVSEEKR